MIKKEKETALEWFNRVQSNRKRLFQNPIQFPVLNRKRVKRRHQHPQNDADANANDVDVDVDNDVTERPASQHDRQQQKHHYHVDGNNHPFEVTPCNVIRMNSNLFFQCPTTIQYYHQIQLRSKRWWKQKHRRRSRRGKGRSESSSKGNGDGNGNHNHYNGRREDVTIRSGSYDDKEVVGNNLNLLESLNLELFQSALLNPDKNSTFNFVTSIQTHTNAGTNAGTSIGPSTAVASPTPSMAKTLTTGIAFMDQIFQFKSNNYQSNQHTSNNNATPFIELIGSTSTGKTHVLMSLAANYVVATSPLSLQLPQSQNQQPWPFVIMIDPEHAINAHTIQNYVESATLQKWNKTQQFRYHYHHEANKSSSVHSTKMKEAVGVVAQQQQQQQQQHNINTSSSTPPGVEYDSTNNNEHVLIDQDISQSLNRIHIIHPKDFANGYIATLECIHDAIVTYEREYCKECTDRRSHGIIIDEKVGEEDDDDEEEENDDENDNTDNKNTSPTRKANDNSSNISSMPLPIPIPPILILLDSIISAFDSIDKMHENIGRGLSGRTEFIQQLKKICKDHNVVFVTTRTIRSGNSSFSNATGTNATSTTSASGLSSSCDGWNKMVTSRITLCKVVTGSKEEQDGYDFVALMPVQRSGGGNKNNNKNGSNIMTKWNQIIPFSITDRGIRC